MLHQHTPKSETPHLKTIFWPAKNDSALKDSRCERPTKKGVKRNQLNFLLDYRRTHQAKSHGWKKCISEQCNRNINHSIPFPKSPREFYAKGTLPHSLHVIYAETVLRRSKNSLGCSTCSWDWLGWTRIIDLRLTDAVVLWLGLHACISPLGLEWQVGLVVVGEAVVTSRRQLPFLLGGAEFLHPSDFLQQRRYEILQVAGVRIIVRKCIFLARVWLNEA